MKLSAMSAAVAAVIVTGCASTQTVLNKPVTGVFHSDKSQNDVAFCFANKNLMITAMDRDDGSKVVLVKNGYGGVSMAFTIWKEGTGSRTDYRLQFGTIGAKWKQCVGAKG